MPWKQGKGCEFPGNGRSYSTPEPAIPLLWIYTLLPSFVCSSFWLTFCCFPDLLTRAKQLLTMPQSDISITSSPDSTEGNRRRVGQACERCRMKKSRCNGSQPCTRCKADNTICIFGKKKKAHVKNYPKGFVFDPTASTRS